MKLVAVTVVKNEADIIEAFVRHTCAWADHHLILDDESTDGTRQILAALSREGLPVTLFSSDVAVELAPRSGHQLTRLAFSQHGADWVLPLNADEFLAGVDRAALEHGLAESSPEQPATIPLVNYSPTTADDPAVRNPVLRIRHRQHGASGTSRVMIPRDAGVRPGVEADQGNHALFENGTRLESRVLGGFSLARLALRSPQQQVLHVVTGELRRLSRGRNQAGLDTHHRLGFQALAQNPEAFFSTVLQPPGKLVLDPVAYRGGPLHHEETTAEIVRSARAFLPFLENLARSHGQLVDRLATLSGSDAAEADVTLQRLEPSDVPGLPRPDQAAFSGFVPLSGWQKQEGPVPSAFLPVFHWATAPETVLSIHATETRSTWLHTEVLTYAERQVMTVVLNGIEQMRHVFTQVNQKETLTLPLALQAGENRLVFRHRAWLHSVADPRLLAVIFLSLRVQDA